MCEVASEKDPLEHFSEDPNHDSLNSQESSSLSAREARVQQLTDEKASLAAQLESKTAENCRQREAYISRYVNADYLLALFGSRLVAKRLQSDSVTYAPRRQQQQPTGNTRWAASDDDVGRGDREDPVEELLPLRACGQLLEPATNLVYQRMHEVTKEAYTRVRQSHDDLLAWKFTPESPSGRKLMAHVRQLLAANQQLGQVNHADRIGQLESEVDLETKCIKDFVDTHQGINMVLSEAYTDLEGLQSSLLILHQQINQTEAVVEELQSILETRQPGRVSQLMAAVLAELTASEATTTTAAQQQPGGDDSFGEDVMTPADRGDAGDQQETTFVAGGGEAVMFGIRCEIDKCDWGGM